MARLSGKTKLGLLRQLLRIRIFEEKVLELIEGKELEIGFHLLMGHEASAVGVASALRADDYVTSNHRTLGRYLTRNGRADRLMAEIFGKATGVCKGKAGEMLIADRSCNFIFSSVTVGAGIPVAVGAALAIKMQKRTDQVVGCFFGEAASSNAAFHEALNLAGVHKAPVVFACENNGYSINVPQSEVLATKTVAERAAAYGMPGVRVDGSDVEAVYRAATAAVRRARRGGGPTLIEIETARLRPHKEGLADTRSPEEMARCWKKDPVSNYLRRLKREGHLSKAAEGSLRSELSSEVMEAVNFAKRSPYPDEAEIYRDLYDESLRPLFSYTMG
jgi:pyruvate dehydrogenase E1 component alpha subunit